MRKLIPVVYMLIALIVIIAASVGAEPTVTDISPSTNTIIASDAGNPFLITVTYSEDMNTSVDPTVTFTPDVSTTLTGCAPTGWFDATTFLYTCTVVDANIEAADIDVNVSGAINLTGTVQEEGFEADVFSIDTVQPVIASATASPDPADAGTVTVTVVFSESMDNTTEPTVQVTGLTSSPYAVTISSYLDDTWEGTFTLADDDEDTTATISVVGAADANGNAMDANTTAGTFEVDTVDDTSPPVDIDNAEIDPIMGYGRIYNDPDGFFSKTIGNNIINFSINLTDATGVANATFDMTQVCSGVIVTKISAGTNGFWWANCTVNVDGDFESKNITITACDNLANCQQFTRAVILYNYTTPPDVPGVMEFGADTTDLSAETNLADVNYILDIWLNGSLLPGAPWTGFEKAALLNFTSLNMTSADISSKLQSLSTAIDISIAPPGEFGTNRIDVDTAAFAELDTGTEITLYNLPFKWDDESQATVLNDTGGRGGITVTGWDGDGITGNLTFSVEGFSGYNVTDSDDPTVSITAPDDDYELTGGSVTINVTANGTGSEISEVVISFGGVDYSWIEGGDFTCSQVGNSEIFNCNFTTGINSGEYEITATAYDYGGVSPGNDGSDTISITVNDTEAPVISGASPSGAISYTTSATLSVTTDENATCRYSSDDTNFANMTAMTDATTTHTQTVTVAGSTSYTFYVRCKDWANNTNNESAQISFSVNKRTSSGGGGGGGGGGAISNPSNSQNWTHVTPGAATIMKLTSDDYGVKEIIIMVNNPVKNMTIRIEKLTGLPASVTKNVTGKIYKYLKIDKTNLNDTDLNGTIKLKFSVTQAWLLNNKVAAKSMVLKRYADNEWKDLKTTLLTTDSKYAYYEAETPSLSYFAIGEASPVLTPTPVPKPPEQPTTPIAEETGTGTEQPAPEVTPPTAEPEKKPAAAPTITKTGPNKAWQIAIVIIVIIAIALVILSGRGKDKGSHKPIREVKG